MVDKSELEIAQRRATKEDKRRLQDAHETLKLFGPMHDFHRLGKNELRARRGMVSDSFAGMREVNFEVLGDKGRVIAKGALDQLRDLLAQHDRVLNGSF